MRGIPSNLLVIRDLPRRYHPLVFMLDSQGRANVGKGGMRTLEYTPTFTSHWKGDEDMAGVEGNDTGLLDTWGQEFKTNLNSFPTDTYLSKLFYVKSPGKPLKEIYYG